MQHVNYFHPCSAECSVCFTAHNMTSEYKRHDLSAFLGSLKLAPIDADTKRVPENPFYLRKHATVNEKHYETDALFGPHCGCSINSHTKSRKIPEHAIFNQKQFKQRSKRFESKLLKQPTLKLIENCVDDGLVSSTSATLSSKDAIRHSESDVSLVSASGSSASNSAEDSLDESSNSKSWSLPDGEFSDFKSLIAECEGLTLSPTSPATCESPPLHRTKNFRTHHTKSTSGVKLSIQRPSTGPLKTAENGVKRHHQATTPEFGESSTIGSSGGASCSQQALSEANCDVTIDELASYFETFVHIPKKMSVMAEMMYI